MSAAAVYEEHDESGGPPVTKTWIDIDGRWLAEAAKELGTTTDSETVNAALKRVVRFEAFRRQVEFARSGGFDDLLDPEIMGRAWR